MQAELISSFSDYSKTAVVSAKELLAINSKLMGKLLDSQITLAALYVESSEKQMGLMESIDNPSEFLNKETSLFEDYSNKFADVARESMQIVKESSEEYKSWVESGLKVADEAFKHAHSVAVAEITPVKVHPEMPATKKAAVRKAAAAKKPVAKKTAVKKAPVKKTAKK